MSNPIPSSPDQRALTPGFWKHMPGLDGVRGLAILAVMAVHFIGDTTPVGKVERLIVALAHHGTAGVDLFFVLSGFLITGILHDSKGRAGYFRNFYARRTLRIFPLYYLALFLVFVVWPAIPSLATPALARSVSAQAWVWTYGINIYIALKGDWVVPYVGHFWSLAVEEHFYLFWPLVVYAFRREALLRICLGVIGFSVLLRVVLALLGVTWLAGYTLTPCRLDALGVGALFALLMRAPEGLAAVERQLRRPWLWLAVLPLLVPMSRLLGEPAVRVVDAVRGLTTAIFFGAVVVTAALSSAETMTGRIFRGRVLGFFGRYSYGIYVYHGLIGHWLYVEKWPDKMAGTFGGHGVAVFVQAVMGTLLSVFIAVASYELFEKQILRLKARYGG